MRYGTLVNGMLVPAPNPICIERQVIYNPPDKRYKDEGYLPIVDTPMPETEDGPAVCYASRWEEQDGRIVRIWTETEPPVEEPAQPTTEDRLSALEAAVLAMMGGAADV